MRDAVAMSASVELFVASFALLYTKTWVKKSKVFLRNDNAKIFVPKSSK
jgi:hypothetical protein